MKFLRFADLKDRDVVRNWTTLLRPWTTEITIRVCWIDVAQCKPRQLSEKLPLSLPNYPKKVPTAGCG
jgi:hypothetical protein